MNDCSRVAPQAIADAADGMSLASFAEVLRCGGEEELVSGAVVAATEKSEAMLSFQFGDDAWVPMHVGSNVQKSIRSAHSEEKTGSTSCCGVTSTEPITA